MTHPAQDRASTPVVGHSPKRQLARVAPFGLTLAVALAIQPFTDAKVDIGMWWMGVLLALVVCAATILCPWPKLPPLAQIAPALGFLVAVALIRHSTGGASSGTAGLMLFPVLWFGLYGGRRELGIVTVSAASTLMAPLLIVGGPLYPASGWRSSLLLIAIGTLASVSTRRLRVELSSRSNQLIVQEAELRDSLDAIPEPVGRYEAIRDEHGTPIDLQCIFVNRAGIDKVGAEILESRLSERLAYDTGRGSLQEWLSVVGTSNTVTYDGVHTTTQRATEFAVQLVGMPNGLVASWRDVTAERRSKRSLDAAVRLWQSVAAAAADATITLDSSGIVLDISTSLSDMLGLSEAQALGANVLLAIHPDDQHLVRAALVDAQTSAERRTLEFRALNQHDGGRTIWMEARFNGVRADGPEGSGAVDRIDVGLRDITASRDERVRLGHQATHDSLTGLLNRSGAEEMLTERLSTTDRPTALVYLDLDRFKPINDTYGHAAGDEALIEIGRRLASEVRQNDVVARLGGDEFIVVGDGDGLHSTRRLIQRLQASISAPIQLSTGEVVSVGASFGIATGLPGSSAADLLTRGDADMYRAKVAGSTPADDDHGSRRIAALG